MTDAPKTLDDLDASLLHAANLWLVSAARERAVAMNLHDKNFSSRNATGGALMEGNKRGEEIRRMIRDAELHAKLAEDQALKIRATITGPNRRGAGKKEPLAVEAPPMDNATKMLLERKRAKEAAKEERRVERDRERHGERPGTSVPVGDIDAELAS